jgi:hypothetical protein
MNKTWLVLFLAIAIQAAPASQQREQNAKAVIQGAVTRSDSGDPVAGVRITVQGGKSTTTDKDGRFVITDVVPGVRYTLQAQKDGFYAGSSSRPPASDGQFFPTQNQVTSSPERRQIMVDSAQTYTVNFELVPGGSVSGRILGPDRKPISRLNVSLLRLAYTNGKHSLEARGSAETDDLGEFRIFWIEPGDYFLSAEYRPQFPSAAPNPLSTLGKTYYPGVLDQGGAASINIRPSGESAADFFMASTEKIKISGRVINAASNAPVSSLYLIPRGLSLPAGEIKALPNQAADRSDGRFELRDVSPGSYFFFSVVSAGGNSLSSRTPVDTGYSDVEGITAVLHANVDLKGQIVIDASGQSNNPIRRSLASLPLTLRAIDPVPSLKPAMLRTSLATDGSQTFTFSALPEGTYQLGSIGFPGLAGPNWYLVDFRQGARSILEDGLVTVGANGAEPLQLTFKPNGGKIQGTVTTTDRKPAAMAAVSLVPEGARRQNPLFYKRATADLNGRFAIAAIGPGDYKLFAWENLPNGADENTDFIARFERDGQPLTVTPGLVTNISLKMIPDKSQK